MAQGPDGTLSTLHCEEPYRGRGLAKALAVKLIQDHVKGNGGDGYCFAHVAPDNVQSQAVCRSLGGEILWTTSWFDPQCSIALPRVVSNNKQEQGGF